MKVAIHYFSGCGNTAWVAEHAQKHLIENGHDVVLLQNIELAFPEQMPDSDVDLFLSPTYFFDIPANVIAYLKRLPMVAGRKAVFWSVNGGVSGFSYAHAKTLLIDKGYEVISCSAIEMPDTFLFLKESQLTPEQRREILQNALLKIADNLKVLDVLPIPSKQNVFKFLTSSVIAFFYLFFGRHILGLSFVANSYCVRCQKCVRDCPVHAIVFDKVKPKWNTGCVGCFRCINNCPVSAIDFSKYAFIFGLSSGLLWAVIFGFLIPLLKIVCVLFGFFFGWFVGAFIFQKLFIRWADKTLCLANKKRVLLTDDEKHL